MTLEMGLTLGILATAILLFLTERLRVDVVALGVVIALMLSGLLPAQDAVAGFANPVVLTIAALFIVGGGVVQTGLAGWIGRRILSIAGRSEARLVVVVMAAVALLSSILSSRGTVAVLLPAIVSLARSARISPSRLLIPLSFGALLGGTLTLIGMLALLAANVLPIVTVSLLGALAMILTGCLTIDEAYGAVDWKSIVLIAGMLPKSTALERVGLVRVATQGLIGLLGGWGPLAVLAGLFLFAALLT